MQKRARDRRKHSEGELRRSEAKPRRIRQHIQEIHRGRKRDPGERGRDEERGQKCVG